MLGKIFNLGKKKEFYLAIDETIEDAKETISNTTEAAKETVTEAVTEAKTKATEIMESAPSPEEIVETVGKSESKSTNVKASKKTKQESEKKPATPANSGASSWEQPFWVKAMYKNASSNSANGEKTEKTFATDYLIVQSKSRRRPGPSLNKFKDMVNKNKF